MSKPIEIVVIRRQQKFDLNDVLNPLQIEINDDQILNIFKKHKYIYYKVIPQKLHKTDTCRELEQCKSCPGYWKNCKYTWKYKFKLNK